MYVNVAIKNYQIYEDMFKSADTILVDVKLSLLQTVLYKL